MPTLIAGLVIFLGMHSIAIVAPGWRDAVAARLGMGWRLLYSAASIVGFVLIVTGYGSARMTPVVLYTPPVALRWVALVLLAFVFPLLLAAYLPGRIRAAVKHPMLTATVWAFAHLLANGTLADVVLFGGFLAWAVADRISVKRRTPRAAPALPATPLNDAIAVIGGLVLYGLFVHTLHAWLIGMPIVIPGVS
jgi:uncharacterized membrane protein